MTSVLLNDLDDLSDMEGHDAWRAAESRSLTELVQKRLRWLQNPADCSKARKLVCNLNKVPLKILLSLHSRISPQTLGLRLETCY